MDNTIYLATVFGLHVADSLVGLPILRERHNNEASIFVSRHEHKVRFEIQILSKFVQGRDIAMDQHAVLGMQFSSAVGLHN
jgi:hypothetical protein